MFFLPPISSNLSRLPVSTDYKEEKVNALWVSDDQFIVNDTSKEDERPMSVLTSHLTVPEFKNMMHEKLVTKYIPRLLADAYDMGARVITRTDSEGPFLKTSIICHSFDKKYLFHALIKHSSKDAVNDEQQTSVSMSEVVNFMVKKSLPDVSRRDKGWIDRSLLDWNTGQATDENQPQTLQRKKTVVDKLLGRKSPVGKYLESLQMSDRPIMLPDMTPAYVCAVSESSRTSDQLKME